jgi:hypothetical protein
LISIKNEVIDTEYEINENVNKTQKEVDNHETQIFIILAGIIGEFTEVESVFC